MIRTAVFLILLGFALTACTQHLQGVLFGCKKSPNHGFCPKK